VVLVEEELGTLVVFSGVVVLVVLVVLVVVARSVARVVSAVVESTASDNGKVVVVELVDTVESVGTSSTIGDSTQVRAGSNSSDALTGATGNDATIAANTATKHAMRLCERARKNSLVPLTPRIHRN
jgi:Na+-transporting methylmalonyl-CoA/oxaloacetate decarboxylase gamma subunit